MLPEFRTGLGNPPLIEPVLIKHPKLRVNVLHAGYPYLQDQMVWADAIGMAVENVRAASFLSEAEKQDIFYNNARRFFRFK